MFFATANKFREVAERSKAHAWKACILQKGIEGSNPFLSAKGIICKDYPFFIDTKSLVLSEVPANKNNLQTMAFQSISYASIFHYIQSV